MSRQEKTFTRSRSFLELLLRARKSEEMIHVHAEAEKNTNSVAEDNKNVKERGEKKLPALFSFM